MIRLFLIIFFLFINIEARENPFFPSEGEKDIPYTSNDDKRLPKLKRATITLPTRARVIKKVTIEYKNLDGSIENKSIELSNSIDWHLPIFISQSYTQQATEKEPLKKAVQKKKTASYKKIAQIKYCKFYSSKNSLKIITQDKLLRNFLLVQPHRIVMDFKRDSSMKTYLKKIPDSIFTKIRIGNHKGYYRVVVELDGYYRYKLKILSDGYKIILK